MLQSHLLLCTCIAAAAALCVTAQNGTETADTGAVGRIVNEQWIAKSDDFVQLKLNQFAPSGYCAESEWIDNKWIIDASGSVQIRISRNNPEGMKVGDVYAMLYERQEAGVVDKLRFGQPIGYGDEFEFWLTGPVVVQLTTRDRAPLQDVTVQYAARNYSDFTVPTLIFNAYKPKVEFISASEAARKVGIEEADTTGSVAFVFKTSSPNVKLTIGIPLSRFRNFRGNDTVEAFSGIEPHLSPASLVSFKGESTQAWHSGWRLVEAGRASRNYTVMVHSVTPSFEYYIKGSLKWKLVPTLED